MKTKKNSRQKYQLPTDSFQIVSDIAGNITSPKLPAIQQLVGSSHSLHNDFDLIQLARKGVKKNELLTLAKAMGLNQEELCKVLHISTKTFQRLDESSPLDIYTSEQALEMALLYEKGLDTFTTESAFQRWLKTPIRSLNMQTPLSFLDTGFGAKKVLDTLGAIEEGVFA